MYFHTIFLENEMIQRSIIHSEVCVRLIESPYINTSQWKQYVNLTVAKNNKVAPVRSPTKIVF